MKSELKAKFLNHLLSKKKDQGFTLIELLVVIIIIGILSAIALPSFLNQANKGKQSEAKQNVGTLNRVQQSYYMENNTFAISLSQLANAVQPNTANYKYAITPISGTGVGTNAATAVANTGTPNTNTLKPYIGGVFTTQVTGSINSIAGTTSSTQIVTETNTVGILCELNSPSTTTPGTSALSAPSGTVAASCNTSVSTAVNN